MIASQGHRETVIIVGALQGPEIKGQIYTVGNRINGWFGQEKETEEAHADEDSLLDEFTLQGTESFSVDLPWGDVSANEGKVEDLLAIWKEADADDIDPAG